MLLNLIKTSVIKKFVGKIMPFGVEVSIELVECDLRSSIQKSIELKPKEHSVDRIRY